MEISFNDKKETRIKEILEKYDKKSLLTNIECEFLTFIETAQSAIDITGLLKLKSSKLQKYGKNDYVLELDASFKIFIVDKGKGNLDLRT